MTNKVNPDKLFAQDSNNPLTLILATYNLKS